MLESEDNPNDICTCGTCNSCLGISLVDLFFEKLDKIELTDWLNNKPDSNHVSNQKGKK